MTTGVYQDPEAGATVYHFPLALKSEGVTILDTWRTLGMRGTGSHDIELKGVFVPDAAMQGVKRPAGAWHPFMHVVVLAALPIFYGAYVGVIERAREIAFNMAARRKDDPLVALLVGELENDVVAARIAHDSMVGLVSTHKPGPETSSAMICRRTVLVNALMRAANKAMEVGSGAGFYRSGELERCFRDVQGARYHPVAEKPQEQLTGRFLLGFEWGQ
ncbi:MAG TPA: acyl-CoA dehydrogenase family protein [Vicinamibacterales bacterium]|nr:acyl-CoA dehydrogenase family protein [Vicinamibacterales bacterium]